MNNCLLGGKLLRFLLASVADERFLRFGHTTSVLTNEFVYGLNVKFTLEIQFFKKIRQSSAAVIDRGGKV